MLLRQVTGPASAPVTLDEAKALAIVDHTDDDALISSLIAAAARLVGEAAGRVLTEETWAVSLPAGLAGDLVLPKSPVRAVSSITYFDADDVEQNAAVADFYLTKDDDRAYLRPKSGKAWPVARADREDAITVEFTAGYEACPVTLKQAVLITVAHLYDPEAREKGRIGELPAAARDLIALDRLGWVA